MNLTVRCLEKYSSPVQQLAYSGWHQVNRKGELLSGGEGVGDGRAEGSSAIGDEGKLQCHLRLTSMAQVLVPCWNQMHVHIFESL